VTNKNEWQLEKAKISRELVTDEGQIERNNAIKIKLIKKLSESKGPSRSDFPLDSGKTIKKHFTVNCECRLSPPAFPGRAFPRLKPRFLARFIWCVPL